MKLAISILNSLYVPYWGPARLFRPRLDALVFPAGDVLEGALEVLARIIETGRVVVCVEIRVDQLDEAVEVFCRYLLPVLVDDIF